MQKLAFQSLSLKLILKTVVNMGPTHIYFLHYSYSEECIYAKDSIQVCFLS